MGTIARFPRGARLMDFLQHEFTHILESLLHIHHNRYLGIDRDREATCRRLARQAALAQCAARLPETA